MAFQGTYKFINTLTESNGSDFSQKRFPKILNKPIKITHRNDNNEKNVILNNSKKTNLNGAKKKPLSSLKHKSNTINNSGMINIGRNNNDQMNIINTQSNSITRTESSISFRSEILNFTTSRNKSFAQTGKKKKLKLKIDSSKPLIHNSQSLSKKGDKALIYRNSDRNLDERFSEIKVINNYFENKETESLFKKNPKLDSIDLSKVNKNIDGTKNTVQNEDAIKKKEVNQIKDGVNCEIKKEIEIKDGQSEICDKNYNNIKNETEMRLDENNIDAIVDNIKKDIKIMPEIKPDQNSIIENKHIKKETEINLDQNKIISNNNIKTDTEIKLDQNNIGSNNNIKTDTEIKLDQNNIGSNNIKTDTEIKLDQNNIGSNNIKTNAQIKPYQNSIINNKNVKTDTEIKLDQNNIGNDNNIKNKKTDTEIKLDENKIGVNDEKESETNIMYNKALNMVKNEYTVNSSKNEKRMKRDNTLDKIIFVLNKKNNKNTRESNCCDINKNKRISSSFDKRNINNQNRNNNYINNKNYVANNYCNNINANNCFLPNISRNNGYYNNNNLYNNNNYFYNSNKNLKSNQFCNNYNYYCNNNF